MRIIDKKLTYYFSFCHFWESNAFFLLVVVLEYFSLLALEFTV